MINMTCELHEAQELQELQQKVAEKDEQDEPRAERRLRLVKQVSKVLIVTLAYVALGASITWPSPAVSSIEKDNSTLVGTEIVLTAAEKDMTGSLMYLGSLFGAWIGGWVVSKIGRRLSLQLLGLPFITGWIISGLASNTAVLLIGRLIHGISSGCLTIAGYAYIVELSDTNIRGMMATLPTLGIVLGNLYTVAIGYTLPWHYLCFVGAIPAVVFAAASFILPKSPSYLVIQGRRQEALSLLKNLRGNHVNIEAEVTQLEHMNSSSSSGWKGLLNKETLRRITVVVTTFFLSQMCGNFVMMIYTARIMQNTGSTHGS
ncbi:hypothetical protein O3P69_020889 [Scylla paramamosain]|uniref:Major facilitator superfamily (MFS) profile domain-containing protein n=1 Tax=Scylla paramamosain TaxID=85552 RepID=A0AAW0TQD5_SCYPA